MSTTLHQPHDALFRKAMSYQQVAKEIFLQHLPAELQKQIDWTQLKIQNATFVDESLKRSAADVLYEVKIQDEPAYLYLLCEHASEPDGLLAFRLVKYILRILQQYAEQNEGKAFPAVYPVIFYTGKKPYNETLDWYTLFGNQANLMRQVFSNPCQLINVCKVEDEALNDYLWAGALELIYKYRYERQHNEQNIERIGAWLVSLERVGGLEYVRVLLEYLLNFYDAKQGNAFISTLKPHLTPTLEKETMTIGEQLRDEGRQQGIQQGMQAGM